ncbi:hypothetical protein J6U78_03690 [bacterium]|nr:hypothetical protein [bacterium]
MTIIAIDPGLNGGIAWKGSDGKVNAVKMPQTIEGIDEVLMTARMDHYPAPDFVGDDPANMTVGTCSLDPQTVCYMEEVHSMPGQGVTSMWTFGEHYGMLIGLLYGLQIPRIPVRPKVWQKAIGASRPAPPKDATRSQKARIVQEAKNQIKSIVQARYPHLKVTLKTGDALGILYYTEKIK